MLKKIVLLCMLIGGSLLGCASTSGIAGIADEGQVWVLESARIDGQDLVLQGREVVTLEIHVDGKIAGRSSVNHYGAQVEVDHGALRWLQPIYSTQMAGPAADMELENVYLRRLPDTQSIKRKGKRLMLDGKNISLVYRLKDKE